MSESQAYSWAYVAAARVVRKGPCELLYAYLVPSGATTNSAIYDGVDTNGAKIADLKAAAVTGHPFKPSAPVYCKQGLYVDVGTSVSGIFVQWRNL